MSSLFHNSPSLSILHNAETPAFLWSSEGRLLWANAAAAVLAGRAGPVSFSKTPPVEKETQTSLSRLFHELEPEAFRLERLNFLLADGERTLTVEARRFDEAETSGLLTVVLTRVNSEALAVMLESGMDDDEVAAEPETTEETPELQDDDSGDENDAGAEKTHPQALTSAEMPDAEVDAETETETETETEESVPVISHPIDDGLHDQPEEMADSPLVDQAEDTHGDQEPETPPPGMADEDEAHKRHTLFDADDTVAADGVADHADKSDNVADEATMAAPIAPEPVEIPLSPRAAALLERVERPFRFVWETNAEGCLDYISREFVVAIGIHAMPQRHESLQNFVRDQHADQTGRFTVAMTSRAAWSGISLDWPLAESSERAFVELSASPIESQGNFSGFRGFGIVHGLGTSYKPPARTEAQLAPLTTEEELPSGPATEEAPTEQIAQETALDQEIQEPVVATPVQETEEATPSPVMTDAPLWHDMASPPMRESQLAPAEQAAFREIGAVLGGPVAAVVPAPLPVPEQPEAVEPPEHDTALPAAEDVPPVDVPAAHEEDRAEAEITHAETIEEPATPVSIIIEDHELAPSHAVEPESDSAAEHSELSVEADKKPAGSCVWSFAAVLEDVRTEEPLRATGESREGQNQADTAVLSPEVPPSSTDAETPVGPPMDHAVPEPEPEPEAEAAAPPEAEPEPEERQTVPVSGLLPSIVADEVPAQANVHHGTERDIAELRAILDTATDGVLTLDEKGVILSANRSAEALFGFEAESFHARPLIDLLAAESQRSAADYLDGLARNGVASVLNDGREVIGLEKNGGRIPLFMTIGRMTYPGEADKFCVVLRDITQWKTAERELTTARREAEDASQHKSDFLAKISHEIRTPLNAIIGFSELMVEERFGPFQHDRYKGYVADIHAAGCHLMGLVNDLLDLSKIEAGKVDLTFTAVKLTDVVQQSVAAMQPQANREGVILRTSLPRIPPVVADMRSLRQILFNLLSNAIKFTKTGGQVIVSTAMTDAGEIVLRVRDTGIGMRPDEIATALEPFRQITTSGHDGSEGTGLGLPLTKALAEANRASFTIESTPSVGTLTQITFPATRVLAE